MKSPYVHCDCPTWMTLILIVPFLLEAASAFLCTDTKFACSHRSADSSSSNIYGNSQLGLGGSDGGEEYQDAYGRTIQTSNDAEDEDDPLANASKSVILDPLVVCGPSGVGKGTLIECLRSRFPSDVFAFSVSHTTRQPRPGEVHGEHYHFTNPEDIQRDIDQGLFVEHAQVHGNYYGTSKQAIEVLQSEKKITILDIDVQGVISVKESRFPANFIFIAPPSMMELENRLRGRGTETEEAIQKRLGNAAKEIEYGEADGNFDHVFFNNDVEETVDEMIKVLLVKYPQLKKFQDAASLEAEQIKGEQTIDDDKEEESGEQSFDFLAESDKMLYFPSVRAGHDKLEVTDRSSNKR